MNGHENYIKVAERTIAINSHNVKVRVWRPRNWMPLPAYCLLQEMERVAKSGFNIKGKNITTFNPDYRAWDAKTAVRYSRGRNVADIYFCKILCRPNSKEARQEYEKDNDITYRKRLHVRFDSRRFDLLHASQIDENDQTGIGDLYKVNDNKRDLKEDYL